MGDIDPVVPVIPDPLGHLVDQPAEGLLAAAGLADVNQVAIIVDVQERLDAEGRTHHRRHLGDPPAPVEVEEVVDGEVVDEFQPVAGDGGSQLVEGLPLLFQLYRVV